MGATACSCLSAPTSRVAWIDDACEDAVALARLTGWAAVCVALPVDLPADPIALFCEATGRRRSLLWDDAGWLLAIGEAATIAADGPGRTAWIAREWATLTARTITRSPVPGGPTLPLATGAWTFEDTGLVSGAWGAHRDGARLVLPRLAWWRGPDGRGWEIRARRVAADEDYGAVAQDLMGPPPLVPTAAALPWPRLATDFTAQVEDAVALINDGAMRKVVLARAVDEPVVADDATILARLGAVAGSTVYAHDLDDGGLFIGATPELLFAAEGTRLMTMALAGTCPRGAGEAEDLARSADLLASTKQRKEHGVVVEHLAAALRPRASRFTVPPTPHQRNAGQLIHLETLLTVDLRRPDHLDVLAALHPTPAVCGLPTPTAAHYLARHEGLQRGLYAGLLGWFSATASRVVVPLRGGLLSADRRLARLFAGAGIVETSEPEAELQETEAKLRLMRGAIS